mmetsp:Transcript_9219/g.19141  ORF Transcript_9219/g.19141 Transcript_9219/m.19141 type:complete len:91 (-) Transcript_9219:6-278(-)
MVVLPAASSPTMRIRISFLPKRRSHTREKVKPMIPFVLLQRELFYAKVWLLFDAMLQGSISKTISEQGMTAMATTPLFAQQCQGARREKY